MNSNPDVRRRQRTAGFSLLEMVIVIGIIAVILGGAVAMMGRIGERAKDTKVEADFRQLEAAVRMYQISNGGFPTTQQGLQALVEKPADAARKWKKIMDDVPRDPWGQSYGYKYPGTHDPSMFELISKGPDGQEGTDDDISSQGE